MARLKPTYALTVGSLTSNTDTPAFGPGAFTVQRDMDIPADALHIQIMQRAGINLEDEISLELGFDGENENVFQGQVVKIRPALDGLSIYALGKMNALLNLRAANTYEGQSAGAIISDLVEQAGLETGTVDDGPTLPRFAVDRRVSAYVHARGLADRLGYELYTNRDGAVMFHALVALK